MCEQRPFTIVFYESPDGDKPALSWTRSLSVRQRRTLGYGLYRLLQRYGVGVCDTEFGRQLGGGLFEFRLRLSARQDGEVGTFRVFCHAAGNRVVLLLGGYDKSKDPSKRRQALEIRRARRRLADHLQRRGSGHVDAPDRMGV